MPFGLTNALPDFMDLMNRVCKPYLEKFVIMFINDILIYSKSKEDHKVHLKLVLKLLKKEKLYAMFSKCEFWLQEVHFLRHVVDDNDIHVDPNKIKVVKNWNAPKSPSEIRSFLGLAGGKELNHDECEPCILLFSLVLRIRYWQQSEASKVENAPAEMLCGMDQQMKRKEDGCLYFMDLIWVPLVGSVRTLIMDEAHAMRYSLHLGADKMYYDLIDMCWWPGMKKDIATYVSKCLTCSNVKVEHQRRLGLLQQQEIPEWKWERITMGFIMRLPRSSRGYDIILVIVDRLTKSAYFLAIREDYKIKKLARLYIDEIVASWDTHLPLAEFSYNNSYHSSILCAPFEALYGRKCRSPILWAEIRESRLIGPELVQETTNKLVIKERLKAVRDCQKNYADNRRKLLAFSVRDLVFLKVSPWKGVVRFGEKGKLAPRYVGPFEIIERISHVAYRLRLPQELMEEIKVDKTLRFVEEPVKIMDRKVKRLKRSRIAIVKVR
nr:retrotransposon protein, putative, Ty3-gypsy subclass [Tanacetum cinerariifolium]